MYRNRINGIQQIDCCYRLMLANSCEVCRSLFVAPKDGMEQKVEYYLTMS